MRLLSWNCRGSGGTTVSTINRYLRCTGSQVAFISETRCKVARAELRIKRLTLCNSIVVPSNGRSGGLWLLWGDEVKVSLVEACRHYIVAEIVQRGEGKPWLLIGIYGDPGRSLNNLIWENLEQYTADASRHVCLMGDFNAIAEMNEKWGGSAVLGTANRSFRDWMNSQGLIDLGHHGPAYTWTNKRQGLDHIQQRLDRAIASLQWTLKYPDTAVFHLPRFQSDHLPILVRTDPKKISARPNFRVENWWAAREDFQEVLIKVEQHQSADWSELTKNFKEEVRTWEGSCKTPDTVLRELEAKMLSLNAAGPQNYNKELEDEIQQQHSRCLLMQEIYWHQRSRVNWAMLGDRNSKYFHAMAVTRKRRNTIRNLRLSNGEWAVDEREIRNEFVTHFKGIYQKSSTRGLEEVYDPDFIQSLPKVRELWQGQLTDQPTDQEIVAALATLGPHKAPGPDGFNAKIVQDNWGLFGPVILKEVNSFFTTGVMPSKIARSNLVLIPKTDDAERVEQYRPISVCNLIYKIISKVLTLRIKSVLGQCISGAQGAFLKGRDISQNVILLREVLHSFNLKSYKRREFCLKVDLSKAFDRMDWTFLESILTLYGFPTKLTGWIMACVRSAQFTIIINGKGDGFFSPQSGLRQGCSLSPYLFILGMDILSRSMQVKVNDGKLTGVCLAPTAVPLTDCLYADDLLIFGKASRQEARTIGQTLLDFMKVSGQRVGPAKSSIWFSGACTLRDMCTVSRILGVPLDADPGRYLGAPINTSRESFDFLISKVFGKLNAWKGRLLSQAARVVLIKSVLLSLPIYYMATVKIPSGVIKEINALIRRFFWGKMDQNRYLSYVAWEKVAAPICFGGLNLRDMEVMNEAMLLKALWKLASGVESQWGDLVNAKYLPRSLLWQSRRTYSCSAFWRSIMRLREKLLPHLSWEIGDGKTCTLFGQPWCQGMLEFKPTSVSLQKATISEFVEEESGCWKVEQLVDLIGHTQTMSVVTLVRPPQPTQSADRLIFLLASDGRYSVKKGYRCLKETPLSGSTNEDPIWLSVWNKGSLLPRIRIFIWKLLNKALPLATILVRRNCSNNPLCCVCAEDEEDVSHLLFRCPFSRACWFSSNYPLRTDYLPQDPKEALALLMGITSDEEWTLCANTMWALWRCRNDQTYSSLKPTQMQFKKYLKAIQNETLLASCAPISGVGGVQVDQQQGEKEYTCRVDGSWLSDWKGGAGMLLFKGEELVKFRSVKAVVCCPLQSEAWALKEAITWTKNAGISSCTFISDSKMLVQACKSYQPPVEVDWRAQQQIMDCWMEIKEHRGFDCEHTSRELNVEADLLAKYGRDWEWDVQGCTFPLFRFL